MCLPMINMRGLWMCGLMVFAAGGLGGATPEDDAVGKYLEGHGLGALLEVQLFDRLEREDAGSVERVELAGRLGAVYLKELGREGLGDAERKSVLVKGQVLVGMVPRDALLDLQLALLVERYKSAERAVDLDRIGLLDDESKSEALVVMRGVVPEFGRIRALSGGRVEALGRSVSRLVGAKRADIEKELATAREVRSRASFFGAWAGYGEAVLSGRDVKSDVFFGFGRVLGFDGKVPVLDRVDLDLLEYEHVARAMIGVALCKMHNENYSEARVWLSVVEESSIVPETARNFAHQRQLEVLLLERDWVGVLRRGRFLGDFEPESLLGVAQARLLVLGSLSVGDEGGEGIREVARMGLDRLVELGEIGHVLELRERFGELPMLEHGFVSQYVQGLGAMGEVGEAGDVGEFGGGDADADYGKAAEKLRLALESDDADRYKEHGGNAALKLAFCELQLDRYAAVIGVLDAYESLMTSEKQREESQWMQVLALDGAVSDGQVQMEDRFKEVMGAYIRSHPSTERSNTLIVRYAMTDFLEPGVAVDALEIQDTTNPMAFVARRKLIQLMYKNPELFVVDGVNQPAALYELVLGHGRWLWEHEPREIGSVGEASDRLAVCRIVLGLGTGVGGGVGGGGGVDIGDLERVIQRAESIVDLYGSLGGVSSELRFRRVQVLLMGGQIDRAGAVVLLGDDVLDDSVAASAMLMVYEKAAERFVERPSVPAAQGLIRYGRVVLEDVGGGDGLDTRSSMVAEGMASAAYFLYEEMDDELMFEYAGALSLRVYREGVPSRAGLVLTGTVVEEMGHADIAMECWLRLVGRVDESTELWGRARYESLRLLKMMDADRARSVYGQYVALYSGGIDEPWGSKIEGLFGGDGLGGDP